MSVTERRQKVVKSHPRLSLEKQCELLEIQRSGLYYTPKGESAMNLHLMELIDKQFIDHPYYGVERMTDYLGLALGHRVNVKRIRRLYKIMNLKTIYAYPKTTKRDPASHKYPYLLRNSTIERPNQVWQTDITYIPMWRGFMYMVAIIDVNSRKILNWSLSNSMTAEWCAELLRDTIDKYRKPETHNSDQGSQFTSEIYIDILKKHDILISMDGKEERWTMFILNVFGVQ